MARLAAMRPPTRSLPPTLAVLFLAGTPAGTRGAAPPACPGEGWTLMAEAVLWRGDAYTVCEEATPGGALRFQSLGLGNGSGAAGEPSTPPG